MKNIQKLVIPSPAWYIDRKLRSISLGGFLIVILVQIITINTTKLNNINLHTSTLSILCNLSSSVHEIEPLTAQRLVGLFEMADRRLTKALAGQADDLEISIYADLIATIFELWNTILTYTLKHNPHLVYSLLPLASKITPYQEYDRFALLVANILRTVAYFHERIGEAGMEIATVERVLEVVGRASLTCTTVEAMDVVGFGVVEKTEAALCLLPIVWGLVMKCGTVAGEDCATSWESNLDLGGGSFTSDDNSPG